MTAIIGHCLPDGFFLAADSRRMDLIKNVPKPYPVKKIYKLRSNIVVCTGGLGTIGHEARENFTNLIKNKDVSLKKIVAEAKKVFIDAYNDSLQTYPGHTEPLYAILAGQDQKSQKGFLVSLRSVVNFQEFWIKDAGRPYFIGSNTKLVQDIASQVYNEMTQRNASLSLDLYALEAMRWIAANDIRVGFPIQLTLTRKSVLEQYPVGPAPRIHDDRFKIKL